MLPPSKRQDPLTDPEGDGEVGEEDGDDDYDDDDEYDGGWSCALCALPVSQMTMHLQSTEPNQRLTDSRLAQSEPSEATRQETILIVMQ